MKMPYMYIYMRCCEYIEDSYVASYCYKINCCCYKHVIFGSVYGQLEVGIAIVTASWLLVELLYICSTIFTKYSIDLGHEFGDCFLHCCDSCVCFKVCIVCSYVHTINDKKLAGLKFANKSACWKKVLANSFRIASMYIWCVQLAKNVWQKQHNSPNSSNFNPSNIFIVYIRYVTRFVKEVYLTRDLSP